MRSVRLEITPTTGAIHPVGELLAEEPGLERVELVYVDTFLDATGILFYRLRGEWDDLEPRVEDHPLVVDSDVFDAGDGDCYWYLHVEAGEPAASLMAVVGRNALIVDTPIEIDGDSLWITVAGKEDRIQQAYQQIPGSVDYEIVRTSTYDPSDRWAVLGLTTRQREVLQTAVDLGYYDVPKRSTHQDIAAKLDCATSTVDEHLRKAESAVLSSMLG